MSTFGAFLAKYVVHHDSDFYSHQSMIDKAKYKFDQNEMDEMLDTYCKVVYENPDMPVSLMERASDYTTLRGDFDIKIKQTDMERLKLSMDRPFYTMDEVKAVINMFYEAIFLTIKNPKPHQLYCFLMEKKKPTVSGEYVKSGFHIEFPFILLSKADQSVVVFPKLVKDYELLDIFSRFGDYQKTFFDSNLFNHAWLMYGSRKEVSAESYRLTGIFDKYLKLAELEDVLKERTLYNCNQEAISIDCDPEFYLPRIMSINHHGKKEYICRTIPMELTSAKSTFKKLKPIDKSAPERAVASTPEELLKEVREIMPFLSAERAHEHNAWMRVGWALHNIGVGSQDALQIWIDFSKRSDKASRSETSCIYEWAKMDCRSDGPKVTIGTLRFFAQEDDPEEYNKYRRSKSKSIVLNSIEKNGTLTPYAAAQALYHQYKNDFVYTESKMWFHYDTHRWNPTPEGLELRKRICDLIAPIQERIDKIRKEIRDIDEKIRDQEEHVGDYDEEDEKVSEKDKVNKDKLRQLLIKEKNRLEDTTTKDKIIKECRELFLDKKFEEKTDSNVYLLGFMNGVLDLSQGVFRDGRPDDYVTFCTGYDFKEYADDAPEMKMVEDYLLKVFPDSEIRNYFLNQACLILRGGNILKKVMVWTGHGDNSKSVTIELLQNILGQYAIELPTALLTQQRAQSSAASPELVRTKGRRFAMIQEPDVNDTINTGILKQLSGNDVLSCRGLFQSQIEFRPQLKLAIICNKLPKVPSDDQATWNRLRVIPFEAKFIDPKECAPTFEEQFVRKQFPMDPLFSEKLPKMKEAFMYMLYKRYLNGEKYGFSSAEPEKVICATKIYRAANDLYMNFLSEKLVEDTDSTGIMLADLYENFRSWFKNNYNSKYIPPKLEMVEYMKTRYKRHFVINRLIGFRYRTEEDDEAEANAEFDRMQTEKEQIAQMRKEFDEKQSMSQLSQSS